MTRRAFFLGMAASPMALNAAIVAAGECAAVADVACIVRSTTTTYHLGYAISYADMLAAPAVLNL